MRNVNISIPLSLWTWTDNAIMREEELGHSTFSPKNPVWCLISSDGLVVLLSGLHWYSLGAWTSRPKTQVTALTIIDSSMVCLHCISMNFKEFCFINAQDIIDYKQLLVLIIYIEFCLNSLRHLLNLLILGVSIFKLIDFGLVCSCC
jgi:hypothetical protein